MIIEEGTYADFKRSALLILDYNAGLERSQLLLRKSRAEGYALHFQGETVGRGLLVLWFGYEFAALLHPSVVVAALQRLAEATGTLLVGVVTETTTVVSYLQSMSLEAMDSLHKTKAGRAAFQTDCPTDYHTLFPFKTSTERIEQDRTALVISLLAAQRTKAKEEGGNDWANFALESVVSVLKLKEQREKEAETKPDTEPDKTEDKNAQLYARRGNLFEL